MQNIKIILSVRCIVRGSWEFLSASFTIIQKRAWFIANFHAGITQAINGCIVFVQGLPCGCGLSSPLLVEEVKNIFPVCDFEITFKLEVPIKKNNRKNVSRNSDRSAKLLRFRLFILVLTNKIKGIFYE